MTPIDDFFPGVMPFVRGASTVAMRKELIDSMIEFCTKTKVWQETLFPSNITAGETEIDLELPDGAELVDVRQVFYGEQPLDPMSDDALLLAGVKPTTTGTPKFWKFSDMFVLQLSPIPIVSESRKLTVRVSLCPERDADELPDALHRRYREEIGHGALSRLLRYPDIWAKEAAAEARARSVNYPAMFQSAIDAVSHKVSKANVRGKRRVTPQYF